MKMTTVQEKVQRVIWFAESKSVTTVQGITDINMARTLPPDPALGGGFASLWKQRA